MNSSKITASQLAAISRTSERPISERLRQLEHSKDENVSLQSISALRPSLRVHLPHPRPLISLPDKLYYVRSAHILYSRSFSFTQNWIIIFGYVRANFHQNSLSKNMCTLYMTSINLEYKKILKHDLCDILFSIFETCYFQ